MKQRLAGILLAAGQSQRFGRQKLVEPLENDVPMIVQTGNKLLNRLPGSIAVVHNNTRVTTLLENIGFECVINPHAESGMSSSIKTGIQHRPDVDGWLITPGDMPFISTSTINKVIQALEKGALIAAPIHKGQRGHPVGFSSILKEQLLALQGDRGARSIIHQHKKDLKLIEVNDPGVLLDIDVPEDLATTAK